MEPSDDGRRRALVADQLPDEGARARCGAGQRCRPGSALAQGPVISTIWFFNDVYQGLKERPAFFRHTRLGSTVRYGGVVYITAIAREGAAQCISDDPRGDAA